MIPVNVTLAFNSPNKHKMSNFLNNDALNPSGGREDWKRVLDWLIEIGTIPTSNPLSNPNCEVIQFAQAISDGVLLCQLINLIVPNAINNITFNTCFNNACINNVTAFLEAINENFDIPEEEAFEPHDLIDFEDFGLFLKTISKISHHKLAIAKGAQPFDLAREQSNPDPSSNGDELESNEDIYTNLQQYGNCRDHSFIELDSEKHSWDASGIYQNQDRINEVRFSSTGSSKRRTVSASHSTGSTNSNFSNLSSFQGSLLDSNVSSTSIPTNIPLASPAATDSYAIPPTQFKEAVAYEPIYAYVDEDPYGDESLYQALIDIRSKVELPPTAGKLHHILDELCNTEMNYLNTLEIINKNFRVALEPHLDKDTLKCIFINVQQLESFHKKLLSSLRGLLGQKKYEVSNCFTIYMDQFALYSEYASKVPDAILRVKELNENPKISKLLELSQESSKQKFPLKDLLTMPIQRVLKYPLLLKELIKNSPEEESKRLEKTLVNMEDIAKHINCSKNDYEKLKFVSELYESVENLPSIKINVGQLLIDGEMKVKFGPMVNDPKLVPERRAVFLFQRSILVCEKKKKASSKSNTKYIFKELIFLNEYQTEALYSEMPRMRSDEQFQSGFICIPNAPNKITLQFYARTPLIANKWNVALLNGQRFLNPKEGIDRGHQFQLFSSNQTTRCTVCDKILWGLYDQGYRCPLCEESCHRVCIPNAHYCGKSRANTDVSIIGSHGYPSKPTVMKRNQKNTSVLGSSNYGANAGKPTYIALFDYNAEPHPGGSAPILLFKKDDEITIVSSTDREWWEGKNNRTGQMGLFPSRSVGLKSSQPSLSYMDVQIGQFQPPNKQHHELPRRESIEDFQQKSSMTNLTEQPWYVGKMSRHEAEQTLDRCEDGVYLMRESDQRPGEYALAIRYDDAPKHIRISYNPKTRKYYMVEAQPFSTLIPLVEYYQTHSLNVCFQGINTNLQKPYWTYTAVQSQRTPSYLPRPPLQPLFVPNFTARPVHKISRPPPPPKNPRVKLPSVMYCQALYDFDPSEASELSFRSGQNIKVINKETDHMGWWLGECDGRIGLFPANYVRLNEFSV